MTNKEITILLGGIIFLAIGIVTSKNKKWKNYKTYIPIFIGLFLTYISTIGPLSKSQNRIDQITTINSRNVQSIIFQPSENTENNKHSMILLDTVITNTKQIALICDKLHQAEITGVNFMKNLEGNIFLVFQNKYIKFWKMKLSYA